MQTPSYLESKGSVYSHKYSKDSGMIATDLKWQWTSSEDLYKKSDPLRTEAGIVNLIKKVADKGVVAEHNVKAVNAVSETGEVEFRQMKSLSGQFGFSPYEFKNLGKPQSEFKEAIILSSDEYNTTVLAAKKYKDETEAKTKANEEARAAKLKVQQEAKIKKVVNAYKKGDVFKGKFLQKGTNKGDIIMSIINVELKAGKHMYTVSIASVDFPKETRVFKGVLDENAKLILDSPKAIKSRSPIYILRGDPASITMRPISHIDNFSFDAKIDVYSQFTGDLVREK